MASLWIRTRPTKDGGKRHRVEFRVGGADSKIRYGGSFKTKREASMRAAWIGGELAAKREPLIRPLELQRPAMPALPEAFERWRASRIDVDQQTANMHRSAVERIFKVSPQLRTRRVDQVGVEDATELVALLVADGYKRETIRKTRTVLAQALDHYEIDPNPARDPRVKLPKERKAHIPPPLAERTDATADPASGGGEPELGIQAHPWRTRWARDRALAE